MPSFAEGFGLPVVEALDLGTPVIASDLAVFREIAGDVPDYLDPRDSEAWFRLIAEYGANGPARRRQVERAAGFRAPGWSEHFERVDRFLDALDGQAVRRAFPDS
jgi:glycosyltransferase involved in cell wall biosynthesis